MLSIRAKHMLSIQFAPACLNRDPACMCAHRTRAIRTLSTHSQEAVQIRYATGTYAGCMGTNGISSSATYKYDNNGMFFYYVRRKLREIIDGTSKTFLVGEVRDASGSVDNPTFASNTCHWAEATRFQQSLRCTINPLNSPYGTGPVIFNDSGGRKVNAAFSSEHSGGGNFVHADGHVDFVSDFIDTSSYKALLTIAGEEIIATQ